jgi:hypothetical protein
MLNIGLSMSFFETGLEQLTTLIKPEFEKLREQMGLKNMLTLSDVLAFYPAKCLKTNVTFKNLPMHLLRGIIFVNCNIRDNILSDLPMDEC